jgi:hypothetical protein
MLRILMVGAAIVAAMIFAQREHWLARAGLVGNCRIIAAPYGDTAQWWSCRQGVLTGFPVLTRHDCDEALPDTARERTGRRFLVVSRSDH